MLVRDVVAAAVGAVLHRRPSDKNLKKGKATLTMDPTRRDYGSAARSERRSSYSGSHSGERLHSVPEDVNDSLSDYNGEPSAWNDVEDGGDERNEGDEEDWENSRHDYRRSIRFYAIVPIGSALFFLFTAFIPKLIASAPLPTGPSATRLLLSMILSASLWCLAHALRVPLHLILSAMLTGLITLISSFCSKWRRTSPHPASAQVATLTSIIHTILIAFLQESLRLASFAMLDLHWHQSNGPSLAVRHPRASDAAFREVWALALGWALAEVCAGVLQGYEQLALYADIDFTEQTPEVDLKNGDEGVVGEGTGNTAFDEEAVRLVRRSMPCTGWADDDDVEGAKALSQTEIDSALSRLANVRAREELEELYGEPYIDIPVFVPLLQRLDSLLLSLGITLLLAAAYLPKPPFASSTPASPLAPASPLLTTSFPPPSSLTQPASHTHMLPITPTFLIVAFLHAALGALHAPPILARMGLPAAAYASCIVGLALTFAGVGVWVDVW